MACSGKFVRYKFAAYHSGAWLAPDQFKLSLSQIYATENAF